MAVKNNYEKLLEPGYIGRVKTRNRLIKSAACMFIAHEDDIHARPEWKAHYERFAMGGVGLINVDAAYVDYPNGSFFPFRYRMDDDRFIEGASELVEIIHRHDCPTFLGLNHDGPFDVSTVFAGPNREAPPIASSSVYLPGGPLDLHNEKPRPLTIPEIENIIEKFAKAALRAKKAGFDGVDINAGSSHLLHNFLSPFWNKREDIYGGSLENRARMITQIISEIKRLTGKDFPVSIILNGIEMGRAIGVDDSECLTTEDAIAIARLVEKAGADAIQVRSQCIGFHVSSYLTETFFFPEPPVKNFPEAYNAREKGVGANIFLARDIKKELSVPVTVVGRLDPDLGERLLRDGNADFIAMTRRLHADPDLPKKLMQGRPEDIAPCTACGNCLGGKGLCRINGLGLTTHLSVGKTTGKKKIVVIGGGPAGMEAARVSAVRGHEVTLYEKEKKLGGLLPVAATVKGDHPEDVMSMIAYWQRQLKKLGVKVKLGKKADSSVVVKENPDLVFLALGGISSLPEIPGINNSIVVKSSDLHKRLIKYYLRFLDPYTLRKLTKFYLPVGRNVVIIGGGFQGCELGEFLTKQGRKVTIVEQGPVIGEGLSLPMMTTLLYWFNQKGVVTIPGVKDYVEITDRGLTIIDNKGKKMIIEADTIIPALPFSSNLELLGSLQEKNIEAHAIGDCKEPGFIHTAVQSAMLSSIDK